MSISTWNSESTNILFYIVVQLLSHVQLFMTPWTATHQAPLSTVSQSLIKFMSIESMIPSNHLILCHPLLFMLSIFPNISVFSSELALCTGWPKYWSYLEKPWIRFTPENWFCLLLLSWISSYSSETKEKLHGLEYTILNCSLFWIYAYCFEFVTFEEGGKLKVLFEPCYVWGKY